MIHGSRIQAARAVARLAALLLAAAPPARAQGLVALRDADAPRVRQLLLAQDARSHAAGENTRTVIAEGEADQALYRGMQQGDVSIPDFLAEHSALVRLPVGAAYEAACSQQATMPANVMAVYSLPARGAAAVNAVVAAYRGTGIAPRRRTGTRVELGAADRQADSLVVVVDTSWTAPEWAPACKRFAHRAMMTLHLDGLRYLQPSAATERAGERIEEAHASAVARTGLSEEQASALLTAVMTARMDAAQPATLEGLARIPDAEMQASIALRQRNAAWWTRHAAEMEPLAARVMGGLP